MSTEREITFVTFLKTIYEVRPKKRPTPKATHHWKLRVESLKSDKDIRKVEFVLHSTFPDPIQVRKKPPFEIEEDGFGNFEMRLNVKILNRMIPLTYFIELHPQRFITPQFHHSVWNVKPKELEKVLEIGGIPVETFDNAIDEDRVLAKICDYVQKNADRPMDQSYFYPKIYDKVIHIIKRLELSESAPMMMNTADMDMGHSDDSSYHRHQQTFKQHHYQKPNQFDPSNKMKPRNQEFEIKKDLKRKKHPYESSSESDADISHDNLFNRNIKKNEIGQIMPKVNEVKMEKSLKRPDFKQEMTQSKPLPIKPAVKIENKLQKPPKEPKLKLKLKDSNPDMFSKLFEAPDLIVLNKGKRSLAKEKSDISSLTPHDNVKRKFPQKESVSDHVVDDSAARLQKKAVKYDNRQSLKDSRPTSTTKPPHRPMENSVSKPPVPEIKKIKPPEKTMPADNHQKKEKKSEYNKSKKLSSSFYKKPLSSLSSSDSELGSISSKSSSDTELNREMFARKKKSPIDHSKVVVKQLFGDDNDNSDEEDQPEDIADLFSALKNSATKPVAAGAVVVKRRKEMSMKSDDDASSENDVPQGKADNTQLSQPSESKVIEKEVTVKDRAGKATEIPPDQQISLKERRKLAKTILKIKNKRFFGKLQRLLLTSFENRERSVSFDPSTLRLDFHMGKVSDELVRSIRAMVDEYVREHHRTLSNVTNNDRGF